MVCAKCQKLQKTTLATPGVKRKNDMYYGSPTAGGKDTSKTSATQGSTGIGKSKLLSKSAKNPYAAYSSSCTTCKTKTDEGRKYCQRCAYKANGEVAKSQNLGDKRADDWKHARCAVKAEIKLRRRLALLLSKDRNSQQNKDTVNYVFMRYANHQAMQSVKATHYEQAMGKISLRASEIKRAGYQEPPPGGATSEAA